MPKVPSQNTQKIKYFSMFSGIGGFEVAIHQLLADNAVCVGFSEIDKYAISIYKHHFKEIKNYGDATKLITNEIPGFDLLVGGFPCQSFSIAGKRKGFSDSRGTMFFEIARVLSDKRPRYFVLENVKGLLSHENGKTFQKILGILADLNYDVQCQVLNTRWFLPQNRERIFFIGHLRGQPRPEIFPIGESFNNVIEHKESEVTNCLDAHYARGDNRPNNKSGRTMIIQYSETAGNSQGQRIYSTVHYINQNSKIRRLTPTECCFLQGFSKNYTKWGVTNYGKETKEHAIDVLRALRETIGKDNREGWGFTEFIALLEKEILRQELYESEFQRQMEGCGKISAIKQSCQAISILDAMCDMWKREKFRCSPQRQKQIEQFITQLTGIVPKLPYEVTQERGWLEYRISQEQTEKRLGEIYSFTLISDSQRYKCLGNAVSVPVVKAVIEKLYYCA